MLTLTPLPNNSLRLNATYNPNTREYTHLYLTGRGQHTSEQGSSFYLEADYDFLEQRWDTLEVEAALKNQLTAALQSDLNLRYSFFGDGLERARLGLTYDWHCRELFLGTISFVREYIVSVSIKSLKRQVWLWLRRTRFHVDRSRPVGNGR